MHWLLRLCCRSCAVTLCSRFSDRQPETAEPASQLATEPATPAVCPPTCSDSSPFWPQLVSGRKRSYSLRQQDSITHHYSC